MSDTRDSLTAAIANLTFQRAEIIHEQNLPATVNSTDPTVLTLTVGLLSAQIRACQTRLAAIGP